MPLILTLLVDDAAQQRFDALRRAHFPPERNQLAAHVTLFHRLPDATAVTDDVHDAVRSRAPFPLQVTGVRSLGRGVALTLAADQLTALRRELAHTFQAVLSEQDRQGFAAHVTVQNKVSPERARELLSSLRASFDPWQATATGLGLWRYLDGPWEPVAQAWFAC